MVAERKGSRLTGSENDTNRRRLPHSRRQLSQLGIPYGMQGVELDRPFVSGLTGNDIEVLVWHVGMGQPHNVVGELTGKLPGTVRVEAHRALRRLEGRADKDAVIQAVTDAAKTRVEKWRERRKELVKALQSYALGDDALEDVLSPIELYRHNLIPEEEMIRQTVALREYLRRNDIGIPPRKMLLLAEILTREVPQGVIRISYGSRKRYAHHNTRVYPPFGDTVLSAIKKTTKEGETNEAILEPKHQPEEYLNQNSKIDFSNLPIDFAPVMLLKDKGIQNAVIAEALGIGLKRVRTIVFWSTEILGKLSPEDQERLSARKSAMLNSYADLRETILRTDGRLPTMKDIDNAFSNGVSNFTSRQYRYYFGHLSWLKAKEELEQLLTF